MKLTKDGVTFTTTDEVFISALVNNGYEEDGNENNDTEKVDETDVNEGDE